MAYRQCRGLCNRKYTDAYRTKHPNIHIDNVRFGLYTLGFKFCNHCEIFTTQELKRHCKCCGSRLSMSSSIFERRQERWRYKQGTDEIITLTADEMLGYSNMVDEKVSRSNRGMKRECKLLSHHL
jgi:hypothetical protein